MNKQGFYVIFIKYHMYLSINDFIIILLRYKIFCSSEEHTIIDGFNILTRKNQVPTMFPGLKFKEIYVLDQHCPMELQWRKCPISTKSSSVVTSHMWLLSTCIVASATNEQYFT